MLLKQKKSWIIISMIILSFVFLITFVILLAADKNFRDLKSSAAVIFAAVIILVLWILRHKTTSSWGDELQKTVQLEIFSYTFIAFQFFLTFFVLIELAYHFKMEPMEVLITVLFGVSMIQLVVAFFVKRKYR